MEEYRCHSLEGYEMEKSNPIATFKALTISLKEALNEKGADLSLSQVREATAQAFDEKNYRSLLAALNRTYVVDYSFRSVEEFCAHASKLQLGRDTFSLPIPKGLAEHYLSIKNGLIASYFERLPESEPIEYSELIMFTRELRNGIYVLAGRSKAFVDALFPAPLEDDESPGCPASGSFEYWAKIKPLEEAEALIAHKISAALAEIKPFR